MFQSARTWLPASLYHPPWLDFVPTVRTWKVVVHHNEFWYLSSLKLYVHSFHFLEMGRLMPPGFIYWTAGVHRPIRVPRSRTIYHKLFGAGSPRCVPDVESSTYTPCRSLLCLLSGMKAEAMETMPSAALQQQSVLLCVHCTDYRSHPLLRRADLVLGPDLNLWSSVRV
jgi:hypothetical protein